MEHEIPSEPDCSTCSKTELRKSNVTAWEIWNELNEFDRVYGAMGGVFKIPSNVVLNRCIAFGENIETFDKILTIERLMYPTIVQQMSSKTSKESNE